MEYLLQLLIEKIENSENQWKPGANGWKSLSNKAGNLYDDRKHLKSDVVKAAKELEKTGLVKIEWYRAIGSRIFRRSGIGRRIFRHCINCTGKEWILISVQERN